MKKALLIGGIVGIAVALATVIYGASAGNVFVATDSSGTNAVPTNAVSVATISVNDDPYDASGWDGSTNVPTKNAVRDKIEALALASGSQTPWASDINAALFSLTNAFHLVVGTNTDSSGVSAFLSGRRLIGSGNAHGFSDDTSFENSGGAAYNAFDVKSVVTNNNMDHFAGFQFRPVIGASHNNVYGFGDNAAPSVTGASTVVTNYYGAYIQSPGITGGATLSNYYGIYVSGIPSGLSGTGYALYVASGGGFLGGNYNLVGTLNATAGVFTNATAFQTVANGPVGANSSHQLITTAFGPGVTWGATIFLQATVTGKAGNYTVLSASDKARTFRATGAMTFTLPASPSTGDYFDFIQATDGSAVVLAAGSAIMKDGANTTFSNFTSSVGGSTCRVLYDGANWIVMWKNGTWTTS